MGCKAHKREGQQFGSDIRGYLILFLAVEMWLNQLPVLKHSDPGPAGLWSMQGGLYIHSPTKVCYWNLDVDLTLGIEPCPAGEISGVWVSSLLELPGAAVQEGKVSPASPAIFGYPWAFPQGQCNKDAPKMTKLLSQNCSIVSFSKQHL